MGRFVDLPTPPNTRTKRQEIIVERHDLLVCSLEHGPLIPE